MVRTRNCLKQEVLIRIWKDFVQARIAESVWTRSAAAPLVEIYERGRASP
jgi:hypothetical protein